MAAPSERAAARSVLRERSWDEVARRYEAEPLGYVVVDGLLDDAACTTLHEHLLAHWGWRHKDWTSLHLRNRHVSSVPEVHSLATELPEVLPSVFTGWAIVDAWALLYPRAGAGRPHYDAGGLNVTFWPTPDRFNRQPGRGGLVLYESPGEYQPQNVELREGVVPERPEPDGAKTIIPHQRNRAVIFTATTLHRTDDVDFDDSDPHGQRMNLTLAFDRVT